MVNPSTSASDSDNLISNSTKFLSEGVIGGVEGNWECSDSSDSAWFCHDYESAYDSIFLLISLGQELQL